MPSMIAVPTPERRASRSIRTTTVVVGRVGTCVQPSACRQNSITASAWICRTLRWSASASVACSLRRNTAVTAPSTAAFSGAPDIASVTRCTCRTPPRSLIVNDLSARISDSFRSTPPGSRLASARANSLPSSSGRNPGAACANRASISSTAAASARGATRSSSDTIADAAATPITPRRTPSATCGCGSGSASPLRETRGAVASPTCTSRFASPTGTPVAVEIIDSADRNPRRRASDSRPSSTRDRRASSAATGTNAASTLRFNTPNASLTATSCAGVNESATRSPPASTSAARASATPDSGVVMPQV